MEASRTWSAWAFAVNNEVEDRRPFDGERQRPMDWAQLALLLTVDCGCCPLDDAGSRYRSSPCPLQTRRGIRWTLVEYRGRRLPDLRSDFGDLRRIPLYVSRLRKRGAINCVKSLPGAADARTASCDRTYPTKGAPTRAVNPSGIRLATLLPASGPRRPLMVLDHALALPTLSRDGPLTGTNGPFRP